MVQVDFSTVENSMVRVLQSDNAIMKQAEIDLKQYLKQPNIVGILIQIMAQSQHVEARQLSGVLLRAKINNIWPKLNAAQQTEIKSLLIERLNQEPVRLVRRAVIGVVSTLSKHQAANGQWPELFSFLATCSSHDNAEARELGFYLLAELTRAIIDALVRESRQIAPLFLAGMRDSNVAVRVQALRGFSVFVAGIVQNESPAILSESIPVFLQAVRDCMEAGEEQIIVDAFDALNELIELDANMFVKHAETIIDTVGSCLFTEDLNASSKRAAAEVITAVIEAMPRVVTKRGLITTLVPRLVKLAAEYSEDPTLDSGSESLGASKRMGMTGTGDDSSAEEPQVVNIAARLLDTIARECPTKKVWKVLAETCYACLYRQEWQLRRAALMSLAVCAEGCREPLVESLDQILEALLQASQDSVPAVREAACWALGQFAEELTPRILQYHERFLESVLTRVDDPCLAVAEKAVYAIEAYVENLDQHIIRSHLDNLVRTLSRGLQRTDASLQAFAVSALASVAIAAKELFAQYFDEISMFLIHAMENTDDELKDLRAKSIDCMGHVCVAVGLERFNTLLSKVDLFALVSRATSTEDDQLQESVYSFFGQISALLQDDFAPLLPKLLPALRETCMSSEDLQQYSRFHSDDRDASFAARFMEDVDDTNEDDNEAFFNYRVHSGILDMKESAVATIGMLAHNVGLGFEPYLDDLFNMCISHLICHHHEAIRMHAVTTVQYLVEVYIRVAEHNGENQAQKEQKAQEALANASMSLLLMIRSDDDKEVVARCCDAFRFWVELTGSAAVNERVATLAEALFTIFRGGAGCQHTEADEDEVQPEEDDEGHDHVLLDSAADLLSALCKAFGKEFFEYFDRIYPIFASHAEQDKSDYSKAMVVGVFAEVCGYFGPQVYSKYFEPSIRLAVSGIQSTSPEFKRNGIYACGQLIEQFPQQSYPMLRELIPMLLNELAHINLADRAVTENAAGTLCRIGKTFPESTEFPISDAITAVFNILPVQDDVAENTAIYTYLVWVWQNRTNIIEPFTQQFIKLCIHDIQHEAINDTVMTLVKPLLHDLLHRIPDFVQHLPEEQQRSLQTFLQ